MNSDFREVSSPWTVDVAAAAAAAAAASSSFSISSSSSSSTLWSGFQSLTYPFTSFIPTISADLQRPSQLPPPPSPPLSINNNSVRQIIHSRIGSREGPQSPSSSSSSSSSSISFHHHRSSSSSSSSELPPNLSRLIANIRNGRTFGNFSTPPALTCFVLCLAIVTTLWVLHYLRYLLLSLTIFLIAHVFFFQPIVDYDGNVIGMPRFQRHVLLFCSRLPFHLRRLYRRLRRRRRLLRLLFIVPLLHLVSILRGEVVGDVVSLNEEDEDESGEEDWEGDEDDYEGGDDEENDGSLSSSFLSSSSSGEERRTMMSSTGLHPTSSSTSGTAAAAAAASVASAPRRLNENEDVIQTLLGNRSELVRFECPITHELLRYPVVIADGFTYEKSAISLWLKSHNNSPMTGKRLKHRFMLPNHTLKAMIFAYLQKQSQFIATAKEGEAGKDDLCFGEGGGVRRRGVGKNCKMDYKEI